MPALGLAGALALLAALLAMAGIGQALAGWRSVRRFAADPGLPMAVLPKLTWLKPLYGDEPLLEQALASVCAQDYPDFQIVFGVQDPDDAAIAVVRRLQARFSRRDITLVINPMQHGQNRKISNLINMLPSAHHDILLIADSDVHCAPDYLRRIAAAFAAPGVGLVTTLYAGLAANDTLAARLGASAINHGFLPGALMSRDLGREDCLGATMALRRTTLAAIGGLPALADHLADDNVLGQLVRAQGLHIRIAATVPATTVPETGFEALFRHELRWSRTILSLVPVAFALSSIQYPIFWAALAWALAAAAGLPAWPFAALFAAAWAGRALAARGIDAALGLVATGRATQAPIWLLPLRDILSIGIIFASYLSDKVEWRGQMMHTRSTEPPTADLSREPTTVSSPQGTVLS
jgi:ceramide glucosyltransferase